MGTEAISGASSIQMDYMNLLITQLQNQNPLEPMDNDAMTAQLTAISQLEQLEKMNGTLEGSGSSFDKILQSQQYNQATAMISKRVTFYPEGSTEAATGVVERVEFVNGAPQLVVTNATQYIDGSHVPIGDFALSLDAVQSVSDAN